MSVSDVGQRRPSKSVTYAVPDEFAAYVRRSPWWKRAMDIVGALILLAIVLPLLLLVALAIVLDSRGGPLYRHERVGRGGGRFTCWKFRSMHADAETQLDGLMEQNEASGLIFKIKHDPRTTRVGRVLRRASLDELPQLWNVLNGSMSLVGPRPPLSHEVAAYEPSEFRRLSGTPGITGLWQIRARDRHDFAEMVLLDIEYLERVSMIGDAMILLKTIPTVLRGRGSY